MKKKVTIKITVTNEPSQEALLNYTKTIAKLYLDGKIPIKSSSNKLVS